MTGSARALSPVESATNVVTNPIQRGWNSYTDYDDLVSENQALRDQLDRQRGTQAAAEASIIDYNRLLALDNLPSLSGIPTAKAQVVGGATNNIDQIVEINKGSNDGVAVGMPVVNQAGLIGKITSVNRTTSKVMLITDPRYSVAVEILGGTGETSSLDDLETSNTTPSGRTDDENDQVVEDAVDAVNAEAEAEAEARGGRRAPNGETETGAGDETVDGDVPGGTTPEDTFANEVDLPDAGDLPDPGVVTPEGSRHCRQTRSPATRSLRAPTPTATPSSRPPPPRRSSPSNSVQVEKEFGVLEGRGADKPTQIRFLQDIPSLAVLEVGDLVETAGPSDSPHLRTSRSAGSSTEPTGPAWPAPCWRSSSTPTSTS